MKGYTAATKQIRKFQRQGFGYRRIVAKTGLSEMYVRKVMSPHYKNRIQRLDKERTAFYWWAKKKHPQWIAAFRKSKRIKAL